MEESLVVSALKESIECLREENARLRNVNRVLRSINTQVRRKCTELEVEALSMHRHIVECMEQEDLGEQDVSEESAS